MRCLPQARIDRTDIGLSRPIRAFFRIGARHPVVPGVKVYNNGGGVRGVIKGNPLYGSRLPPGDSRQPVRGRQLVGAGRLAGGARPDRPRRTGASGGATSPGTAEPRPGAAGEARSGAAGGRRRAVRAGDHQLAAHAAGPDPAGLLRDGQPVAPPPGRRRRVSPPPGRDHPGVFPGGASGYAGAVRARDGDQPQPFRAGRERRGPGEPPGFTNAAGRFGVVHRHPGVLPAAVESASREEAGPNLSPADRSRMGVRLPGVRRPHGLSLRLAAARAARRASGATAEAIPFRWGRIDRTCLGCTTCTATSGSGARTGTRTPITPERPTTTPPGRPADSGGVLRGGGWSTPSGLCRSALRGHNLVDAQHNYNGFRVALSFQSS